MGVKLVSSGGGSVELLPPTTATNYTATMPAGTGNVVVNGINGSIVSGTATASTSGTSIDFTSIPSWVKRITVMFNGVSTNGTSNVQVQIGAGSVTTTGYVSNGSNFNATSATSGTPSTSGFLTESHNPYFTATAARMGQMVLTLVGSNIWISTSLISNTISATSSTAIQAGNVTLSGTLDRVRITTVNGTDTFDAGSINILYE